MVVFGKKQQKKGFTLIEVLVVIAIIGVLATLSVASLGGARKKANDAKRKSDLSQIGRILYASNCYVPDAGYGDYDIKDLAAELTARYPQYAAIAKYLPVDPKTGTETASNYRYQVAPEDHCVIYSNFENEGEPIVLSITSPAPNSGSGVFLNSNAGPNGTNIYYQISK